MIGSLPTSDESSTVKLTNGPSSPSRSNPEPTVFETDECAPKDIPGLMDTPLPDRIKEAADPTAIHRSAGVNDEYGFRFDLVDGPAMYEMCHVLYTGEKKYGKDNWRRYEIENHLNHIIAHCYAYLAGNRDDSHLANIMCNAMFAQAKECRPDYLGEAAE